MKKALKISAKSMPLCVPVEHSIVFIVILGWCVWLQMHGCKDSKEVSLLWEGKQPTTLQSKSDDNMGWHTQRFTNCILVGNHGRPLKLPRDWVFHGNRNMNIWNSHRPHLYLFCPYHILLFLSPIGVYRSNDFLITVVLHIYFVERYMIVSVCSIRESRLF